jgi:uncharacterized protein YllA (UPF0747 family)
MVVTFGRGAPQARPCDCRYLKKRVSLFNAAGIPAKMHRSTLESYEERDGTQGRVKLYLSKYRQAYRPGETLGSAFARLFSRVFAEWGVILLDASDPELHALAQSVYRAAVLGAEEIDTALLDRGKALRGAGYHEQVKVTPSSTLLFARRDGRREVIHRANGGFVVAGERVSQQQLLDEIAAAAAILAGTIAEWCG